MPPLVVFNTSTMAHQCRRGASTPSSPDFIASVDVQNNNNNAGNPQLVPPQSWLLEVEAIHSLGAAGSIRGKIEAELVNDLVDQIPISATEEAPGNLRNSARRLRGEIVASFLLDAVGIRGGKLDVTGALQTARLTDPLTRRSRAFSDAEKSLWKVDFRHDIPGGEWAWDIFAEDGRDYPFVRLDYVSKTYRSRPFALAFVEHKNILGLKVRATLQNIFGRDDVNRETFYAARRDGPVDFTRDGRIRNGLSYRLHINGTF